MVFWKTGGYDTAYYFSIHELQDGIREWLEFDGVYHLRVFIQYEG